jgi:hypothetical protein
MEIRAFVNQGLTSINEEPLLDVDEVFDELEAGYVEKEV